MNHRGPKWDIFGRYFENNHPLAVCSRPFSFVWIKLNHRRGREGKCPQRSRSITSKVGRKQENKCIPGEQALQHACSRRRLTRTLTATTNQISISLHSNILEMAAADEESKPSAPEPLTSPPRQSSGSGSSTEFEPPLACVRRMLKNTLPNYTNVGKDACSAFSRCCGIFIIYLTACANDFARESKRQTITANDIIAAVKVCMW